MEKKIEVIDMNTVIVDGVRYVAKDYERCDGCAFELGCKECMAIRMCDTSRDDGRSVIWVQYDKQPTPYDEYVAKAKAELAELAPKKKSLPKTWEEFCENNPLRHSEYYIFDTSEIREYEPRRNDGTRLEYDCFGYE